MSAERTSLFPAAAAVLLALSSMGCGSATEPDDLGTVISLTNADHGRTIAVLVGDEIEVTLQTIGPGAYGAPALSSGSVRFLAMEYPRLQNPGGPRQLYHFEAVAGGRAEITIPHMDGFPAPRDPFVVTVDVN